MGVGTADRGGQEVVVGVKCKEPVALCVCEVYPSATVPERFRVHGSDMESSAYIVLYFISYPMPRHC